jgi:phenylpyruvate tautomerase
MRIGSSTQQNGDERSTSADEWILTPGLDDTVRAHRYRRSGGLPTARTRLRIKPAQPEIDIMPLLQLTTNRPIMEDQEEPLVAALSRAVAEIIGKPEDYVMVTLQPGTLMMAGTAEPGAMADLRSIGGLSGDVNARLSDRVCTILHEHLDLLPNRIYLNFTDIPRTHWGWNGSTFG